MLAIRRSTPDESIWEFDADGRTITRVVDAICAIKRDIDTAAQKLIEKKLVEIAPLNRVVRLRAILGSSMAEDARMRDLRSRNSGDVPAIMAALYLATLPQTELRHERIIVMHQHVNLPRMTRVDKHDPHQLCIATGTKGLVLTAVRTLPGTWTDRRALYLVSA